MTIDEKFCEGLTLIMASISQMEKVQQPHAVAWVNKKLNEFAMLDFDVKAITEYTAMSLARKANT
jgi:hypothetical protein